MTMRTTVSLLTLAAVAGAAHATIWGVKSFGPPAQASSAPTLLFSFNPDGSGLTSAGNIALVTGAQIDADALAVSPNHGLLAYWLTPNGSTLVSLNSSTALASPIGAQLPARDIRGAAFDAADRLWALDAAANELLRIDPTTGSILGAPLPITLGGGAYDLTDGTDLALQTNGTMALVNANQILTLNTATGAATLLGTDPTVGPTNYLTGAAFHPDADPDTLFTLEVNNTEDIFTYPVAGPFTPNTLLPNIFPAFNSGRGDLAALVPAPGAAALLGLGTLAALRRRR